MNCSLSGPTSGHLRSVPFLMHSATRYAPDFSRSEYPEMTVFPTCEGGSMPFPQRIS